MRMWSKRWPWLLFIAVLAVECMIGYIVAAELGFINGDAISRLANAYYVLYSRDPHLAAIGFVWNPLPSLLALPILLFQPVMPMLSTSGIAIIIVSALFASFTALALVQAFRNQSFRLTGHAAAAGICCTLLFAGNPFQLWYGANGMSEAIFGFFLVVAVLHWLEWLCTDKMKPLVYASLALAFAFLTRYESIPFTAAMAAATILVLIGKRTSIRKIESSLIVLLLPIIFAFASWVWLNYSIMGDPLYFLLSSYSNVGQSFTLADNAAFEGVIGSPAGSLLFVMKRSAVFMLPYISIAIFRFISRSWKRPDFIAFTLLTFSIPAFQWYMILTGASFGWLRFFYYPLLVAIAWLPYEFSAPDYRKFAGAFRGSVLASFAASAILIWPVMNTYSLAPEEHAAIHYQNSSIYQHTLMNKEIARSLDRDIFQSDPNSLVLTDAFNAYEIILYSRFPGRFVSTTDRDFRQVLADPLQYDTEYILVPNPVGLNELNAVNHDYPGLYEGRVDWAVLVREFPGDWRLFRVIGTPDQQ